LKSGYDSYLLAEKSRDLTTFHGYGLGPLRLTRLPQGYTNSMQVFCRATSHMIGSMAPDRANVFVDDCAGMGPRSDYNQGTIPDNKNIRLFVFEFATMLQELLARVKESGATIAGQKTVIATPRLALLGAVVCGFLGTVGVVRRWIENFAIIAKPLTLLTRKMLPRFYGSSY